MRVTCSTCKGLGKVKVNWFRKKWCDTCGGAGKVTIADPSHRVSPTSARAPQESNEFDFVTSTAMLNSTILNTPPDSSPASAPSSAPCDSGGGGFSSCDSGGSFSGSF